MATCDQCGGIGLVRKQAGERWVSVPCECQAAAALAGRIKRAQIPAGFGAATLETFQPAKHSAEALLVARRYVEEFLPGTNRGLLFTGSVGVGKTHLAAGIALALAGRGFQPLFVYVGELLERLRRSYDQDAQETSRGIMAPVWAADLVVIDELGAQQPTKWSFETVELLIGSLYNAARPVVVTTNFANHPPAAVANEYARAARQETLQDRIGVRMWSRLQQMCRHVDLGDGPDWRTKK